MNWMYLSALLVGLLSSGHCFGMCGGIAAAYAPSVNQSAISKSIHRALFYNSGRLISYVIAGAIAGAFGLALGKSLNIEHWSVILRLLAGFIIVLIGVQLLFKFKLLFWLESIGKPLWHRLAPLTKHFTPVRHSGHWFFLGMLWGWLPCGMVYSMLLVAITSGGVAQGALLMLCFALGTLPSMLLTGVTLVRATHWINRRQLNQVAGAMCILFGAWTALAPVLSFSTDHLNHHEHIVTP